MRIPYPYIYRNLRVRRMTTALTATGMALVVFVFASVLMLTQGIRDTLVDTGRADNVIVLRRAAPTEVQSSVERNQAMIVRSLPQIAVDASSHPLVSREIVVLITLPKKGGSQTGNVVIRGVEEAGLPLRPQVRLVQGRRFRPGTSEIIVGQAIHARFQGAQLGQELSFGQRNWRIVGIFDAGRTGFNAEIWGDATQMLQAFRRPVYSNVTFRLRAPGQFGAVRQQIESDPRLTLTAKRENAFYAEQSRMMSKFLGILGLVLSGVFSIGAIIGAMITMYASVATRTAEIGALRALGFQRRSILAAFLVESLSISALGGIVGIALASCMQLVTLSTMNWQTFSELAFTFTLTPGIVLQSALFALGMGILGGFLPALRAASLNIVSALRAV